jgi:hypothetical protein
MYYISETDYTIYTKVSYTSKVYIYDMLSFEHRLKCLYTNKVMK